MLPGGQLLGRDTAGVFMLSTDSDTPTVSRMEWPASIAIGAIAADDDGRLFVSDDATKTIYPLNCKAGTWTLGERIGTPGGHKPGKFDPTQMATPIGMAVERRASGQRFLWVVEGNYDLRRVLAWNIDAETPAVARDYVGNTTYMGSGAMISSDVPDMGFFRGTIHKINYDDYTYEPVEVMGGHPDPDEGKVSLFKIGSGWALGFDNGHHFISDASGQECEYYVEGGSIKCVFMRRDGRWHCVAVLGNKDQKVKWPEEFPQPENGENIFAWSDLNGDGYQQPAELVWAKADNPRIFINNLWDNYCDRDLTWYHTGLAFTPVRFTEFGGPVYDPREAERLPGELGRRFGKGASADIYRTQFGYVTVLPKAGYVDPSQTAGGLMQLEGYDEQGTLRWTYPAYWWSVHGSMTSPMGRPGLVIGMLKFSGQAMAGGHDVLSIRGNTGQEYLIRDDGLYVGELFTDQRLAPQWLPPREDIAGMPIDNTSMGGEAFSGSFSRQRDGRVRLTYGYTDARIAEVVGLDAVNELPATPLAVTADDIRLFEAFQAVLPAAKNKAVDVAHGSAFDLDASLERAPISVKAGRETIARADLSWNEKGLNIMVRVDDPTPMVNAGQNVKLAFKSGDCISVFAAPEGEYGQATQAGTRVLLTWMGGEPIAVVYRPAGPGDAPYVFESPVRKTAFAYVGTTPLVQADLKREDNSYTVVATVPWSLLEIAPEDGKRIRGDLGVIQGRETTTHVDRIRRWADPQTNVTNDVPTEAEFFPVRWGRWTLTAAESHESAQGVEGQQ
jgi:hypothetical protein